MSRRLLRALLFVFAALGGLAPAAAQPRVASINLCTDQLLMALADPEQIVSLGPFARDPRLSDLAAAAAAYPQNRGEAEEIVRLQPDLVLVGRYDSRTTLALLRRLGLRLLELPPWSGYEAGAADIRRLAEALGHPERGEALIARIAAARAAAAGAAAPGTRALVLGRGGYVDAGASLAADLALAAGFADARGALAEGAGFVPLEALVAARPDVLIIGEESFGGGDQKQAFLDHPALAAPRGPARISLPNRLTACGGPSLPAALDALAAAARRLPHQRALTPP